MADCRRPPTVAFKVLNAAPCQSRLRAVATVRRLKTKIAASFATAKLARFRIEYGGLEYESPGDMITLGG